MALTFVMVCEAQADFHTASVLADRVLCEHVDWIDAHVIDAYRHYKGIRDDVHYLTWSESARRSKALGRQVHGHFEGKPGDLDALAGRKAILVALMLFPDIKAILLIRDSDGLSSRKTGLNQARAEMKSVGFAIVIGVAHCKREAWILAGFEAKDQEEQQQIDALRQQLGFHPCERAQELDATHIHDKRNAKRVLDMLMRGNKDREIDCCVQTPLGSLQQRGQKNGLASYLDEVKDRIVPLFMGWRPN